MNREYGVCHYLIVMSVFSQWLVKGVIADQEFHEIEAMAAEKYGLSKGSIYR